MMANFHVRWEIEVDADNPVDAAAKCLEIMHDPDSTATVFGVSEDGCLYEEIDLKDHSTGLTP